MRYLTALSLLVVHACSSDDGGTPVRCGPGTFEQDGVCVPEADTSVATDTTVTTTEPDTTATTTEPEDTMVATETTAPDTNDDECQTASDCPAQPISSCRLPTCVDGQCGVRVADDGKPCRLDACLSDGECVEGVCEGGEPTRSCEGKDCGTDSCGRSCGSCGANEDCVNNQCVVDYCSLIPKDCCLDEHTTVTCFDGQPFVSDCFTAPCGWTGSSYGCDMSPPYDEMSDPSGTYDWACPDATIECSCDEVTCGQWHCGEWCPCDVDFPIATLDVATPDGADAFRTQLVFSSAARGPAACSLAPHDNYDRYLPQGGSAVFVRTAPLFVLEDCPGAADPEELAAAFILWDEDGERLRFEAAETVGALADIEGDGCRLVIEVAFPSGIWTQDVLVPLGGMTDQCLDLTAP